MAKKKTSTPASKPSPSKKSAAKCVQAVTGWSVNRSARFAAKADAAAIVEAYAKPGQLRKYIVGVIANANKPKPANEA